jgi:F0F1-type ATP synthase delta subunit
VAKALSDKEASTLNKVLLEAFDAKTVDMTVDIDPDLLSGMMIRYGSLVIDASLRSGIERLTGSMKGIL